MKCINCGSFDDGNMVINMVCGHAEYICDNCCRVLDTIHYDFYNNTWYCDDKCLKCYNYKEFNIKQTSINGYKRITKRTAERLYKIGQPVLFCPVKLIPGGVWGNGCIITKEDGRTFEQVLHSFEYYNCNNSTGNYTAFYIKE